MRWIHPVPPPFSHSPISHHPSPFSGLLGRIMEGVFGFGGCGISERLKSGSGDYVGVHVRRAEFNLSGPSHGSVRPTYFEGTERPLSPTGFKGALHEIWDGDGEGNRARRAAVQWRGRKRKILGESREQRAENPC